MKYGVYAVRDALNGFGTMLCDHNDNSAARSFRYAMQQEGAFPRDYDLYRIGSYDCDTGKMMPLDFPEVVVRGIDCITRTCVDSSAEVLVE